MSGPSLAKEISMNQVIRILVLVAAAACMSVVQARTLVVGEVAELSGVAVAAENAAGAKLWFEHASKTGPNTFVVKAYDDQRDSQKTVALTRQLIEQDKAVALFGYRSTPSLEAVAPVLDELQVPLVAPFNGSEVVRRAGANWMFFLRGTYQDEINRLVGQTRFTGIRRFAILHQSDAFGTEQAKAFTATLEAAGLKPTGVYSYDRKTLDTTEAVKGLLASPPEAVLMACTPKACGDIVRKVRESGSRMMFLVLSNAVSDEFLSAIAQVGRGVVMAQVMPYPWNATIPIVKEFNRLNAQYKAKVPVSYAALEGFAAAKLLTIAANKAGTQADAKKIADVLRNTEPIDLGGIVYDPHAKAHFVDLTMVSREGRLIR
jgi:ABC-type branched-subunit amino acid transport system substrate-binding protein